MAARQRLFSYTIISRRVMFGPLSGELRRTTCPQVAVSPMLVLATRDGPRTYRLMQGGIYHAKGMAVHR